MSVSSLPAAAVNLFLGFLLPVLLPATGGDAEAARDAALHLVGELQPQTARELNLATEAVAGSLRGLAMLARSAEPGLPAQAVNEALKWACSLSNAGHRAQRRLDELQRARRAAARRQAVSAEPQAPPPPDATVPDSLAARPVRPEEAIADPAPRPPVCVTPDAEETTAPTTVTGAPPEAPVEPDTAIAQAEAALSKAERLLTVMQQYVQESVKRGAAPSRQAEQQIRDQQRAVEAARMTLAQARRRHAEAMAA